MGIYKYGHNTATPWNKPNLLLFSCLFPLIWSFYVFHILSRWLHFCWCCEWFSITLLLGLHFSVLSSRRSGRSYTTQRSGSYLRPQHAIGIMNCFSFLLLFFSSPLFWYCVVEAEKKFVQCSARFVYLFSPFHNQNLPQYPSLPGVTSEIHLQNPALLLSCAFLLIFPSLPNECYVKQGLEENDFFLELTDK